MGTHAQAHTRRNQTPHPPEEKLEIVLAALRNQASISELCRRHGLSETTFYRWQKQFLEGGKEHLINGNKGQSNRERQLEQQIEELQKIIGELTVKNRLLKKVQRLS